MLFSSETHAAPASWRRGKAGSRSDPAQTRITFFVNFAPALPPAGPSSSPIGIGGCRANSKHVCATRSDVKRVNLWPGDTSPLAGSQRRSGPVEGAQRGVAVRYEGLAAPACCQQQITPGAGTISCRRPCCCVLVGYAACVYPGISDQTSFRSAFRSCSRSGAFLPVRSSSYGPHRSIFAVLARPDVRRAKRAREPGRRAVVARAGAKGTAALVPLRPRG